VPQPLSKTRFNWYELSRFDVIFAKIALGKTGECIYAISEKSTGNAFSNLQ
jgi:hypothetical protein